MPPRPRTPGLPAFLLTQFLGAFNDNAFRFAVLFLILDVTDGAEAGRWKGLAQLTFALPFIVFAVWAGALADRLAKSRIIVLAKLAEVLIMGAGVVAFGTGSLGALALVLLFMSTQSTLFGPAKYGWLAERIDEADLVRANGLVQMTTMIAIVSGQVVGGVIYQTHREGLATGALWFVAIALVGVVSSLFVPKVPPARPDLRLPRNPFPELLATWRGVRSRPTLLYTMLGIGHFFLLAALLQLYLAEFGLAELGLGQSTSAVLVAMATLGIAAGSLLAGTWAERQVELGLVPLGALAMSAGVLVLSFVGGWPVPLPESWERVLVDAPRAVGEGRGLLLAELLGTARALLVEGWWTAFAATFLMGAAGGLFIVPLQALLQRGAPSDEKGRYLAFGNMVSFVGIGLASVFLWLPEELGFTIRQQFLFAAGLGLVGTVVSLKLLPYAFLRLVAWLLAHSVYRLRVLHAERVPERGPALVLCNHVSWVDALFLAIATGRRLRFLMYRPYFEWWPLHWLFELIGCIPVAGGDSQQANQASLGEASRALDEGRVVVVFAEGSITRLGHMLPFRGGYRRIIGERDVPIVPAYLDGLWGSLFSHQGGRLLWKRPRSLPYPVTVGFGAPLPGSATPHEARAAIARLATEVWGDRRHTRLPLQRTLLRDARRDGRPRLADAGGTESRAELLARAWAAGPSLARRLGEARRVALAVAPGRDAAAALLALLLQGRVVTCLDPRRGDLLRRARALGSQAVVTAGSDPQEVSGAGPGDARESGPVVIELSEVLPSRASRARRAVLWLMPWWLARAVVARSDGGSDPDGLAMVVAGSGSDGAECVPLSHFQLMANVEALQDVLDPPVEAGVTCVQDWEEPGGMVLGLWLPLLGGTRAVWHDDPDSLRVASKLTERHRATLLVVSPEGLPVLMEQARPDNLGGVQHMLCTGSCESGALLAASVARFGLVPCPLLCLPEAGGVVTLSSPDVRAPGIYQRGTKEGAVGHPLPGVTVEIVDEEGRPLPADTPGRLVVRGPSVPAEGQVCTTHLTGSVDEDGFLFLVSGARRPSGDEGAPAS